MGWRQPELDVITFGFPSTSNQEAASMSTGTEFPEIRRTLRHELEAIRGQWIWLLTLGIVLVVVGTLAIGAPLIASLATALTIGALLLVGGAAQLVGSFWTRDWSGFFMMFLMGVLYIVVGLLFLEQPISALEALTLLLACSLIVSGIFRIVGSLMSRFPQWSWIFFGGVLNLLLGILIWRQWPVTGLWVIGLFVGIDMIFNGWTWVMLSLRLKSLPRASAAA
jgi:uncharacterized membrane protein HdeD (DUF308 family)